MPIVMQVQNHESIGVKQQIIAGNNFTGVAPTTTCAAVGGSYLNVYPADTVGGLFVFGHTKTLVVNSVRANFGTSLAYVLSVVDLNGAGAEIAGSAIQVSAATTQYLNLVSRILLLPNQALKLTTAGGVQAMNATAFGMQEISYPG